MAKQTFTTGQVLTASQMTSLQATAMGGGAATAKTASYVLVAADAGTTVAMNAAGSTTITVNTGLFSAGDTVFIQNLGAGACTVTAGTATVATAGSLILPQNDAGILYFTSASAAIFYDYIQAGAVSPLTTKGDLYTFSTSDARLGVGANGTTLVADSSEATGLKWATPSSGAMTLLSTTTLSGASTTISSIDQTYKNLEIVVFGVTNATADGILRCAPNGTTNITSQNWFADYGGSWSTNSSFANNTYLYLSGNNSMTRTDTSNSFAVSIFNYSSTTGGKPHRTCGQYTADGGSNKPVFWTGGINTTTAISSLVFTNTGGSFSTGTVLLYGVK